MRNILIKNSPQKKKTKHLVGTDSHTNLKTPMWVQLIPYESTYQELCRLLAVTLANNLTPFHFFQRKPLKFHKANKTPEVGV